MPTLYSRFGAGTQASAAAEAELLQRWAGAETEQVVEKGGEPSAR
jgi:hypothetical protein